MRGLLLLDLTTSNLCAIQYLLSLLFSGNWSEASYIEKFTNDRLVVLLLFVTGTYLWQTRDFGNHNDEDLSIANKHFFTLCVGEGKSSGEYENHQKLMKYHQYIIKDMFQCCLPIMLTTNVNFQFWLTILTTNLDYQSWLLILTTNVDYLKDHCKEAWREREKYPWIIGKYCKIIWELLRL